MTGDVEEPGSANRDDRPRPEDDDRSILTRLWHPTKEDRRIEFCLVVVVPVVVFWLLILFAPVSSQHLDVGEKIGAGMFVTALSVPIMALRMRFWD